MESYSTTSLHGQPRVIAWNEVYSTRLAPHVEFSPVDRNHFTAMLDVGVMGPIRIARMQVDKCSIERSSRHTGTTPGRFYAFVLQVRGQSNFRQYGREASLGAGDFTLCDSAAPHAMRVDEMSEFVMMRVSADVLRMHLPSPEQFCGSLLSAAGGYTHCAASLTTSLLRQLEIDLTEDCQNRIARNVLDLMATSYAIAFDGADAMSSVVTGRQASVKRYIEQNLRDPDLSPCTIAEGLRLSPRYLRMIFASNNGETVSNYILRRRLEECARQMIDPRWQGHTITQIAFGWGFNSAPHFTRSFRQRFDAAPRDYRRKHLEAVTGSHYYVTPAKAGVSGDKGAS
jgi:AraC family transcriptional activator of tynA and feaB